MLTSIENKLLQEANIDIPERKSRKKKSRNYSIDLFRLIGAFFVVLLHVRYGNLQNEVVLFLRMCGRWAVPFFFIVSGYYFQKNYARQGNEAFLRVLGNILPIIVVANLVYLPPTLYKNWGNWDAIFSLDLFTSGIEGHLWFLNFLIVGYLLLWLLIINKKKHWFIALAIILLAASLSMDAYSLFFKLRTDKLFGYYTISLPLLIIGYILAETHLIERKFSALTGILMVMGGLALQGIEVLLLYKFSGYSPHNQGFLLGSLLCSLGMFTLALKIPLQKEVKAAKYGRDYSLAIYLYHPIIAVLTFNIISSLPYTDLLLWINPFFCIAASFFMVWLLDKKFPMAFRFLNGR